MTTMPGLLFLVRSNEVLLVFAIVNVGAYLNSTTSLQEEVADPFVEYNSSLKSSHNMFILFSFSSTELLPLLAELEDAMPISFV